MAKYENANLRQALPGLFSAIEKLTVETLSAPQTGVLHVTAIEMQDAKIANSSLTGEWGQKLNQWFENSGLAKISEPIYAQIDGHSWLLCPISKVKTTAKQKARQTGLDSTRFWNNSKFENLAFIPHSDLPVVDMVEGFLMGCYQLETFKGNGESNKIAPKKVLTFGSTLSQDAIQELKSFAAANILTRSVQDAPANWFNSEKFASFAQEVAKEVGIKCTVRGRKEMLELGLGSFMSVAAGTPIDPKMIILEITGKDPSKTVALIGKGLTFDAGGVSLKPAAGMHEMKYDMSGGAAVLGAAYYLGKVQPKCNVVCVIGAVENVMSGTATKPGDVVRAYNGKTIEILNTDAEGRLVLADLLCYTEKNYKPQYMVNIATLTGAVLMALGSAGAGLMSNDETFSDTVFKLGGKVGEPVWKLPLWPELEKETSSDVADLKNIASADVKAGTIMGGLFLKEFVSESKWAHLDIAGTGWNCKATGFPQKGGSAFGLRILTQICNQEL